MRKFHLFILISLACAIIPGIALAQVKARVDRDTIAIDETLTLFISKSGASLFSSPDLEPLNKNFSVLGQSQSSSVNIINGKTDSTAEWRITLEPRRTGALEIPPLTVGNETTEPLTVRVNEPTPTTREDNEDVFIETSVDADTVYVQSQVILSLRICLAVADARITELAEPQIPDALVKTLEDRDAQYAKMINGRNYAVFERKYAIFPQKSGALEIPTISAGLLLPVRQRSHGFFDPFGTTGKQVKLRSTPIHITVLEKDPGYPQSAVWLPSAQITISDRWQNDSNDLKVGESTTINITLAAEDLMAEQLPPMVFKETEGLKLYQGKAETDNFTNASGISGIRTESIALIPTQPGTFELPEIRIPWWNKVEKKTEYAVIPARNLIVKGTAAKPQQQAETPPPAMAGSAPKPAEAPPLQPSLPERSNIWILLSGVLAIAWLITLYMLFLSRRRMTSEGTIPRPETEREAREEQAFAALARSCKKNAPLEARNNLLAWLKAFTPEAGIRTFNDLEKHYPAPDFLMRIQELDRLLYDASAKRDQWQGKALLEQADKLRKEKKRTPREKAGLEKLYK